MGGVIINRAKAAVLTSGHEAVVLFKLAVPAIFGVLGMVIFNLADTYFVGRLGIPQLAALSFTFPVVLIVNSLALGIAIGTSALISRAVGEGDQHRVKRLATDSLTLAILLVLAAVVLGLSTINPLFRLLGADKTTLPYIQEYMSIWYIGMLFVVVPMVGNNAVRALGDTITPGMVMIFSALINIILDPMLIFGFGPFPSLGVRGAALATVISRMLTFVAVLYILARREKILLLSKQTPKELFASWREILYIGMPNALTRMSIPIAQAVLTGIVANYGTSAVAGYGVATRIEFFALAAYRSLSAVIGPFVGQNLGAQKIKRVHAGIHYSQAFAIGFSLILYFALSSAALPLARLFNSNPHVVGVTVTYLHLVPLSYGFQGMLLISTAVLNVLRKPFHASALTMLQMFVFAIPLSLLGSELFGIAGIFGGLASSYLAAGIGSYFMVKSYTPPVMHRGETTFL